MSFLPRIAFRVKTGFGDYGAGIPLVRVEDGQTESVEEVIEIFFDDWFHAFTLAQSVDI